MRACVCICAGRGIKGAKERDKKSGEKGSGRERNWPTRRKFVYSRVTPVVGGSSPPENIRPTSFRGGAQNPQIVNEARA